LLTINVTGVAEAAPSVHEAVIDVALATVAVPQVPSDEARTVAPVWKPVPVKVKAVVPLGVAVVGDTPVRVGAALMTKPAGAAAVAFVVPPLVFVTVKPSMVFVSPAAIAIVAVS
jgi:hypothetical protein